MDNAADVFVSLGVNHKQVGNTQKVVAVPHTNKELKNIKDWNKEGNGNSLVICPRDNH